MENERIITGFGVEFQIIKHENGQKLTTITNHLAKEEYVL